MVSNPPGFCYEECHWYLNTEVQDTMLYVRFEENLILVVIKDREYVSLLSELDDRRVGLTFQVARTDLPI